MLPLEHELPRLGARVGAGDARAMVELKQKLASEMPRIVRRAMRPTAGASKLTQWVRAAAYRLTREGPGRAPADPEQLVRRIAHDLCESVIGRLQAGRPDRHAWMETVRT
jgi:hypothetical protein